MSEEQAPQEWPYGSGTPEDPFVVPPGWHMELTKDEARELIEQDVAGEPS